MVSTVHDERAVITKTEKLPKFHFLVGLKELETFDKACVNRDYVRQNSENISLFIDPGAINKEFVVKIYVN